MSRVSQKVRDIGEATWRIKWIVVKCTELELTTRWTKAVLGVKGVPCKRIYIS